MVEGLLWFDNDGKKPLAEKVAPAVRRFRERVGREATTVLVPNGEAPAEQIGGVRVVEWGRVMPGYLLVTDSMMEG